MTRRIPATVAMMFAIIATCASGPAVGAATSHRVVRVAAAANVRYALDRIVGLFRARHPSIDVQVAWGSSGSFFQQIRNGAPFDVFLSADADYPAKLAKEGFVDGKPFPYARGRIVLWVPNGSRLDLGKGLEALVSPEAKKIAIANPRTAPYGRAAQQAMKAARVFDAVRGRLVFGESIIQTAQFAQSGAADAGILALSLAKSAEMSGKGRWMLIPGSLHTPIEQHGAILAHAADPAAARLFCEFLRGDEATKVWREFGYETSDW